MSYRTVKIKNYVNNFDEKEAYAALSPGMLLEFTSAGKVQAHSTAGGNVAPIMIALENYLEGKGLDTAYAAADQVQVWYPVSGDEAYVQLEDEQTIAIGDLLESNGAGYVQKHTDVEASEGSAAAQATVYPNSIVAVALEALDLSSLSAAGSSDTPTRQFIRVKIV